MEATRKTPCEEACELQARLYFKEGLNCAECVLLSFLDNHETNLPKEIVGLATGFGGGIGQTRNLCGAITGALMALGTQKGRENPLAKESFAERRGELQQEIYPCFAAMVREIEGEYGTLLCSELTAKHKDDFDSKLRKKSCAEIIVYCAGLAARHAEKGEADGI